MLKQYTAVIILGLGAALPAQGDELEDSAMRLCEKVKACAMAQVAKEDLTPEVREMMQPMLDNMCANLKGQMGEVPTGHKLYQPALQCMRSMEKLDCEMMQDTEQAMTPECEAYEKLVLETEGAS